MAAKLAGYVYVTHAEHGDASFGPSDEVPDWALPLIPNPKAWEGGEAPAGAAADEHKATRRRT